MTRVPTEAAAPDFIAAQYDRGGLLSGFWSFVDATVRAIVFARQCERHFNRYGRISSRAMTRIADRTMLASVD
jgi:hypothetical protein